MLVSEARQRQPAGPPRGESRARMSVIGPTSDVVGTRLEQQLSEDELPYTAIEHDGGI